MGPGEMSFFVIIIYRKQVPLFRSENGSVHYELHVSCLGLGL